jgi:hypothetical protein
MSHVGRLDRMGVTLRVTLCKWSVAMEQLVRTNVVVVLSLWCRYTEIL